MKHLLLAFIITMIITIPAQAQAVCTSIVSETANAQDIMSVNERGISVDHFSNRVQFEQAYNILKLAIRTEALNNDASAMANDSQIQTITAEMNDPSQLGNRVLGELATDVLLWDYASANGIVILSDNLTATINNFFNLTDESPEEREVIIDDFNQRLLANGATLAEISNFFCRQSLYDFVQANVIGEVESTLYINADHILVNSQEVAFDILTLIESGDDFASLARELSLDVASAERGGALGWQPAVFYIPEFERVATQAEIGTITSPVQTPFGWHIIRVNGREERPVDDDLREFIRESLFTRWRNQQMAQANISINPDWQSFIPQ